MEVRHVILGGDSRTEKRRSRALTLTSLSAMIVTCVALGTATAGIVATPRAPVERARSTPSPPRAGVVEVAVYTRDQAGLRTWLEDRSLARTAAGFDPRGQRREFTDGERSRERAIHRLSGRSGRAIADAQRAVIREIRRHGGRVTGALPAPSVVTARLPAAEITQLMRSPQMQAVEVLGDRRYAGVVEVSGANAWHTAGCTGAGFGDASCPSTAGPSAITGPTNSPDGLGGPDLAVDDMGINDHHDAFTGGPTPSLGRTPAVVKPQGTPTDNGSLHANTIAAVIAVRDPNHRGLAPGIDKILDPDSPAAAANAWMLGLTSFGTPGATDLPEAINKSYGVPSQAALDDGYISREADMEAAQYGIAQSASAGNGGPYAPLGSTLRPVGDQYRVEHPCVASNILCVGSVHNTVDTNRANDVVEDFSSRGPSVGGRKKPDLVALVGSGWGCPEGGYVGSPDPENDATWKSGSICGEGTSYSAPFAAGGQLLLAGVGVTSPMAQRAILINSAYSIDSEQDGDSAGQEYWTPDVGWGEIDLAQAFAERAHYRLGTIGPAPKNNARFFRVDGQAAGDRTTLAWNRRAVVTDYSDLDTLGYTTTDLDLHQLTLGGVDDDKDVCGSSTTCGVDLSEDIDTGPTVVTGGVVTKWEASESAPSGPHDTVEQVRAKNAGDSIVKVRSTSTISGSPGEDFAVSSTKPVRALATPTIDASASLSETQTMPGQNVTVTATFTNESTGVDLVDGLDLTGAQATISLPAGVELVAGSATQSVGTLSTAETETVQWTVRANVSGSHAISFIATGQRFGETFESSSTPTTLVADDDPPTVSVSAPSGWQTQRTNAVTWNTNDGLTTIANVLVESSVGGGGYQTVYSGGDASGAAQISAAEGEAVSIRVTATDALGNQTVDATPSWRIDADPPSLALVAPDTVHYGDTVNLTVSAANVGAGLSLAYRVGSGDLAPLAGDRIVLPALRRTTDVYVRAIDELGRVVERQLRIRPQPRVTELQVKTRRRDGRTFLQMLVRPAANGKVAVRMRCGGVVHSKRTTLRRGRGSIRLPRRLGECMVTAAFVPNSPAAFKRATKRLRVET